MADNKLYTKDSIESLSPLEFTRLRPAYMQVIVHTQHSYWLR